MGSSLGVVSESLEDLLESHFGLVPRISSMRKHGLLAGRLLELAKNGVLSPRDTTTSISQLLALQPKLSLGIQNTETFVLELSRGLRTMLSWFRDWKAGRAQSQFKRCSASEKALFEGVVKNMELINPEDSKASLGCLKLKDCRILMTNILQLFGGDPV